MQKHLLHFFTFFSKIQERHERGEIKVDTEKIRSEIEALRAQILYHSARYYEQDAPEISDSEYDKMFRRLQELEKEYPQFDDPTSPTKRVGGKVSEKFAKVRHIVPMLSLSNVFSKDELSSFVDKMKAAVRDPVFVLEYKIDGLSVSVTYENGYLVSGCTRGDGVTGEDITENLLTVRSLPQKLRHPIKKLVVRGEVYLSKSGFATLNREQELLGKPLFANPRNAAAGSLRQLDAAVTASRGLDIFVFNLEYAEGIALKNHSQSLAYLQEQGFAVSPDYRVFSDAEHIYDAIIERGNRRDDLDFDIDGAVIKVDSFAQREEIGSLPNVPKWATAYKYPPESKPTLVMDIAVQVGRTGVLTPIAELSPVRLAGTTVSRATLHNLDFIREKDVRVGDTVLVRKAGEIIPEVFSVDLTKRPNDSVPFAFPSHCPSCGEKVSRVEGEAAVRCTNGSCPAQLLRNLIHFCSRDAMNIEGLGPALLTLFVRENMVRDIADLYHLDENAVAAFDGLGEKSAHNLTEALEKSKTLCLSKVLFGLGIGQIGEKASAAIARKFGTMNAIMNASIDELVAVDDIGEISAENVRRYFDSEENRRLLARLSEAGVNMRYLQEVTGDKLAGMTFVLTGTLPNLTRDEASKMIEREGGKVSSSVSKKTTFVVAGSEAGSKLIKAQALGITLLDEEAFLAMLK